MQSCLRNCLVERLQFTLKLEVTTTCRRAFVTSISQAFGRRNLAIGTQDRLVSTLNLWLRDILPSCLSFLARQDGITSLLGLCVEALQLPAVISGFCGHRPTATRPCAGRTRPYHIPTLTLWNQFGVAVRHHLRIKIAHGRSLTLGPHQNHFTSSFRILIPPHLPVLLLKSSIHHTSSLLPLTAILRTKSSPSRRALQAVPGIPRPLSSPIALLKDIRE